MKVHEFAKQINKESKEVVAALQEKGIDLKPQSLINEEGIRIVKNTFGITDTNNAAAEVDKSSAPAEEKKKKGIIFVSNPQNSKLQGGQKGNYNQERPKTAAPQVPPKKEIVLGPNQMINKATGKVMDMLPPKKEEPQQTSTSAPAHHNNRPAQSGDRPAYNNNRPSYNNNRPAQSGDRPSYNNNRPAQSGDRPSYNNNRPAQSGDRPAYNNNRPSYNNNRPAQNGDRPAYNNNRPAQSGDRPSYNNNRPAQNGDRPAYNNNRPAYNNNRNTAGQTGDRNNGQQNRGFTQRNDRPGFNNNRGPGQSGGYNQNGNRPYNNNERNQGRNDRPDNRFQNKSQGTGFTADAPLMSTDKHREDHRRVSQSKDKRSKKDMIYEDKTIDLNKAGRFIKPEPKVIDKVEEQIKVITVPEVITIKELAEKMKLQPAAIVKKLFLQGTIVTLNQELSFEEAENIAIEYEIMCEKEVKVDVIEELLKEDDEVEEEMITRAPVICVMGHVDHGKTSLLDAIRKTNVIDREAGGITQHIGAYMVTAHDRPITFLDTPGHEAFTAMRMRGANATDIAILVVAADDGVMPQTIEAINHAKAAGIEIIVAVNKMDKPNANIDRVKQELSEYELIPEDWGGSTVFAPVSAKSGDGIPELLEMILLTADILELKANPTRKARGLVIEAQLDKGRGPVATILVQKGTLKVGDFISAGASYGKVRAMIDDKGRRVKEATPSTPVEILGLSDVPNAGEVFIAHDNDKTARTFAETFVSQHKEKKIEETKAKMSLDDLFSQIKEGSLKELNLIIKADVQGSVEAVKESLLKLTNEEVVVKCIHGGVGAISESDVTLAATSAAIIIGFNVKPDVTAKTTAEREGVDIRLYKVIYKAIEDIQAAMTGMLDPVYEEKILGHAEIRQIFKASAIGNIAGSYILDGIFQRGCSVRISREGQQVFEGPLASLKRFKDDVKEVKAGFECGLLFEGFDQMKEFDVVEAYTMVEVPRK